MFFYFIIEIWNPRDAILQEVASLKKAVEDASITANGLFLPILEKKTNLSNIRLALFIFERYKFLFSLPSILRKYLDEVAISLFENNFDFAARDFKRGKHAYSTEIKAFQNEAASSNSIKLIERLWFDVEGVAQAIREKLTIEVLKDNVPFSIQEKNIEYYFF